MSTMDLVAVREVEAAVSATPQHGRRRAEPSAAAGSAERSGQSGAKLAAAAGRVMLGVVLSAAVALFLFLAVGPRFMNYQTSTMLTGSMSPVINPGDVVISVKIPVSELQVGDIITYSIPVDDHRIETHRVTAVHGNTAAGSVAVSTKGDANPGADPWTAILSEDYVYKNVGVVPHLGTGIRALREPPVQSALLYGAPALFVIIMLKSIWAKPREESESPAASAEASEPESVRS